MNLFNATLERADGGLVAVTGSQRIRLGDEALSARPGLTQFVDRPVILGIGPRTSRTSSSRPTHARSNLPARCS